MDQEMQRNPDYNLVMKFLSSITPGDMDKESADQLMMIGQRIQAGGSLTDKEREMFLSVVSAMPEMREQTGAAMTEAEMGMAGPGMTDAQRAIMENEAYNRRLAEEMAMPSKDGMNYSPSSGVSMEPNVMGIQEMIEAGIVKPTRPMARPAAPMKSPRPQARPMRQEATMAQINVANMEENADLFMAKMGFPHDADGLNMTDEQLVNFVLLCQQEYMLGDEYDDEEYEHDCDCEHGEDCDCHHDDMMMDMPEDSGVKVKVMRLGGGNVHELMNEILGG